MQKKKKSKLSVHSTFLILKKKKKSTWKAYTFWTCVEMNIQPVSQEQAAAGIMWEHSVGGI